jgi:transposase
MPAPLPIQLRQRVVNAYKEKGGYQKIADQFDVCMDSVRRWVSLEKAQGSVDPMPHAGGPLPKILESQHSDLAELVQKKSDATLAELADTWNAEHESEIHQSSVWRALERDRITYKKNPRVPLNVTELMSSKRKRNF